ncbi:Copine-8-like [Oopsacas minuta]|uniref:Copine-8-like n=1 Tax=Oopsacas minuta TaxID=111878 RepID=A0AAV7KL74_9METZ|nr:Copine-8-like [Oopsacas minuta]
MKRQDTPPSPNLNTQNYGAINDTDNPSVPLISIPATTKTTVNKSPSTLSISIVWILFFILGMGTLLPWNLFITANSYFIRKSGLSNFEAYLVLVAQTPNFIFFFLTLFIKEFLRPNPRVYLSLIMMLVLFIATIAFTEIDIPEVIFTVITFICVAVINAVSGIYQTSIIGITGVFPSVHTQAVLVGQGLGGILPPLILIISKYIVRKVGIMPDSTDFLNTSACVYFSVAGISILLCIVTFIALTLFPYSRRLMRDLPEPRKLEFLSRFLYEVKLVGRYIGLDCFNAFYVFTITLSVFPALTSSVLSQGKFNSTADRCSCPGDNFANISSFMISPIRLDMCSDWVCLYFTPVFCFLTFNLFDFIGRASAGFTAKCKIPSLLITVLALIRTLFIPFILLCNISHKIFFPYWFSNDYIFLSIMILLGITNGVLSSISMMHGPRKAPESYRETAAILMALSLGAGLHVMAVAAPLHAVTSYPQTIQPHTSLVEISISCLGLKKMDILSKSDPIATLFLRDTATNKLTEIGRTEVIQDCSDPQFQKTFILSYYFHIEQYIKIVVEDYDKGGKNEVIGSREVRLGDIVISQKPLLKPIHRPGTDKETGIISLHAEEVRAAKYEIKFSIRGIKLDKKDLFSKSDPYLLIKRVLSDGLTQLVHKTEVIDNTLNPIWLPFTLKSNRLCGGNLSAPIEIHCLDWDNDGSSDLIGITTPTLGSLVNIDGSDTKLNSLELIHPEIQQKKGSKYKNSGTLDISTDLYVITSFSDHLKAGLQINLHLAIDFTGSNGNPMKPSSLHYMGGVRPNKYVEVLRSVVSILAPYDSDQSIPCYGFGAKLPVDNFAAAHMCFPLNGKVDSPEITGVEQIVTAYQETLEACRLSGPTNVSVLLNKVLDSAKAGQAAEQTGKPTYTILLLLTDGAFSDLSQAVDCIVSASQYPISLVIIGIGNDEFVGMQVLDADKSRLMDSKGKSALRDIVQFVSYELAKARQKSGVFNLAEEVLAEIPQQVEQYMRMRILKP